MTIHRDGVAFAARCAIVVVLCGYLPGCSSRKSADMSQARWNYLDAVRTHFTGHPMWRENVVIGDELITCGSGSGRRSGAKATGTMEFLFRVESPELQRAVVRTMIGIHEAMDVFVPASTSLVSGAEGVLASPEGRVVLRSRWATDKSVTDAVRILRIDYETEFRPQSRPTDRQDLCRLSWATWSPPLDP